MPAVRRMFTSPVAWLKLEEASLTARFAVKLQSPMTTVSTAPSESKVTRRHGVGSLQAGLAPASSV